MKPFVWGKEFITDLPEIDEQHQTLVEMINRYGEALSENCVDEDIVTTVFHGLAEYAQHHFTAEERLMQDKRIDNRHVQMHLQQHYNFVQEISLLADNSGIQDTKNPQMLFDYLVHWLAYHILGCDKNLSRQIKAMDAGMSASEAFEAEELMVSSSTEPLLAALTGLFGLVSRRNKLLQELNQTLEQRVMERTRELLEANQQLEKSSTTDLLTGLPNRRYAMQQLQLLWEESLVTQSPLACLMVDADGFKNVNDQYGHDAGDIVLKRLASELEDSTRSDDIVCRLGGDEFLIICPNTHARGALQLGEQIRMNVAGLKVLAGEGHWYGSVSIGVGVYQSTMSDMYELIKAADEAVYRAKRAGRNCVRD